jgi:hypothetical protein
VKVEIYYEAPDSQVIELTDEQAELWTIYSDAVDRSREVLGLQGWGSDAWAKASEAVDVAYGNLERSIRPSMDPDVMIADIIER